MQQLVPCVQAAGGEISAPLSFSNVPAAAVFHHNCSTEAADVVAYQVFAERVFSGELLSSAGLLTVHNLVSDSVPKALFHPKHQTAYCLQHVLTILPQRFPGIATSGVVEWKGPPIPGLPGLGPHRLIKC